MSIKEYAKKINFHIIGKLIRKASNEKNTKLYIDEGGNEYYINKRGICIVTAEGGVI